MDLQELYMDSSHSLYLHFGRACTAGSQTACHSRQKSGCLRHKGVQLSKTSDKIIMPSWNTLTWNTSEQINVTLFSPGVCQEEVSSTLSCLFLENEAAQEQENEKQN